MNFAKDPPSRASGLVENSPPANSHGRAAWHVNEFCRLVGISRTTFYKAVKAKSIRVVVIGGRTLVPAGEVARLLGEEEVHCLE